MRVAPLASSLLLLLAGCPGGDHPDGDDDVVDTETDDTEPADTDLPPFQDVAAGLGGALLSITGTSATDVWSVGAEDGGHPLVLHYDGDAWTRVVTPFAGNLWWAWLPEAAPGGPLWAVGEAGGTYRLEDGTWTPHPVGDDALTLFGIWGASEDEVWTVGGQIPEGGPALYRWDGESWTEVTLPEGLPEDAGALYKVWGSSADDVWVCGMGGAMLHYDGDAWTVVPSGTTRDLFTVNGTGPDRAVAVGGIGSAAIVEWDGERWTDVSPEFAPDFNGVYLRGDDAVTVGHTGWVWWEQDGAWVQDPRGRATTFDLHATWLDPDGGFWAVGGRLLADPLTDGVLVHAGDDVVPSYTP